MKESTKKLVTWISLAVAIIVSVCAIMFASNQEKFGGLFDVAFWVLILYIVCSIAIWLVFGILTVVKKPKKALIFIGIALVVLVGSFLIAGGDNLPANVSAGTGRLIATACYTTYFVVIAALVLMIWVEISKAFKK